MGFPNIEITSEKVRGSNMDFLTIEITPKKVHEKMWIFDQRNYIEKVRGNDVGNSPKFSL